MITLHFHLQPQYKYEFFHINLTIWRHNNNKNNNRVYLLHDLALFGACAEHILLQKSAGCLSESEYHLLRVDRRIRFRYDTCGRGLNYLSFITENISNVQCRANQKLRINWIVLSHLQRNSFLCHKVTLFMRFII